MEPQTPLTKKEKHELRRKEKLEARESTIQKRRMKRVINWTLGLALVILPIGGLVWYSVTRPPIPESDVVSRNGLHWHPELAIYEKGVKQEIPPNLGMGGIEMPVHTHDSTGVIHLEMSGLVRKEDITLGQFFKVWNKDMRSFGTSMKMTVNGQENTEYEGYMMHDKDKIELQYN
jgi:hypothetical protein